MDYNNTGKGCKAPAILSPAVLGCIIIIHAGNGCEAPAIISPAVLGCIKIILERVARPPTFALTYQHTISIHTHTHTQKPSHGNNAHVLYTPTHPHTHTHTPTHTEKPSHGNNAHVHFRTLATWSAFLKFSLSLIVNVFHFSLSRNKFQKVHVETVFLRVSLKFVKLCLL